MKLVTVIVLTIVLFLVVLGLYPAEGLKCFGCTDLRPKISTLACEYFRMHADKFLKNDTSNNYHNISKFIVDRNCSVCVEGSGTNDAGNLLEIFGCVTANGTLRTGADDIFTANVSYLLGEKLGVSYHIGDFHLTPCAHDYCARPFNCSAPPSTSVNCTLETNRNETECRPIPEEYCVSGRTSGSPLTTSAATGLSIFAFVLFAYKLF